MQLAIMVCSPPFWGSCSADRSKYMALRCYRQYHSPYSRYSLMKAPRHYAHVRCSTLALLTSLPFPRQRGQTSSRAGSRAPQIVSWPTSRACTTSSSRCRQPTPRTRHARCIQRSLCRHLPYHPSQWQSRPRSVMPAATQFSAMAFGGSLAATIRSRLTPRTPTPTQMSTPTRRPHTQQPRSSNQSPGPG